MPDQATTLTDAQADAEAFVRAVHKIVEATDALLSAGLRRRTLCLLLRDRTGLSLTDVSAVLDALGNLSDYLER